MKTVWLALFLDILCNLLIIYWLGWLRGILVIVLLSLAGAVSGILVRYYKERRK